MRLAQGQARGCVQPVAGHGAMIPAGPMGSAWVDFLGATRSKLGAMTPVTTFAGRTVAVFGLGRSGLASCRALLAGGATVVAGDDTAHGREAAAASGAAVKDLAAADWSSFAALVLAPGVPL